MLLKTFESKDGYQGINNSINVGIDFRKELHVIQSPKNR